MVDRAVDDDPVQPGSERAATVEAVERADRGEKRLLGDVLGGRGIVDDEVGGPVGARPVRAEERLEVRGGSGPGTSNPGALIPSCRRHRRTGGELYFADVYCDRRLSDEVRADPVLYGECLGGALYWNDFLPMAKQAGFLDPRLVTSRPSMSRTRRCGRSSARRSSSRRPIGCSSSMGWSRPARITARR